MTLPKEQIFYGDVQVRQDNNGFISLNDMWAAAGCPEGKRDPMLWRDEAGHEFTEHIAKSLNVRSADIYKTTRGTWAHWQIALAYAKYLSPEFHAWANQAIKDRIEEDYAPELGITRSRDRAIENWRKQGKDDDYITARIKGIEARNGFTDTLKNHSVSGSGYGVCTNNIYQPILGGRAEDIKKQKGLPQKANLRDNMSSIELGGVMFAEILAADKIKRENRQGTNSCAAACLGAGTNIKTVLDKHESALSTPQEKTTAVNTSIGNRLSALKDKLR